MENSEARKQFLITLVTHCFNDWQWKCVSLSSASFNDNTKQVPNFDNYSCQRKQLM